MYCITIAGGSGLVRGGLGIAKTPRSLSSRRKHVIDDGWKHTVVFRHIRDVTKDGGRIAKDARLIAEDLLDRGAVVAKRDAKKDPFELKKQQIRYAFANNIKLLRDRQGLTQKELAEKCGMHRVSIMRFEGAEFLPSYDDACILADVLGVGVAELRHDLAARGPEKSQN